MNAVVDEAEAVLMFHHREKCLNRIIVWSFFLPGSFETLVRYKAKPQVNKEG
jgi:hypothetical protein